MCDSQGYIHDPDGIDIRTVKKIKEEDHDRIWKYVNYHPKANYFENCKNIWTIPCDIALPCAAENEINGEIAEMLVANGCFAVGEGANMPCTPEAVKVWLDKGILYGPGKAANAGGVAVSALEMSQNSMRYPWSFAEVDTKLKQIMENIYNTVRDTAKEYGLQGNMAAGANIAGFLKVARAMFAQGVV